MAIDKYKYSIDTKNAECKQIYIDFTKDPVTGEVTGSEVEITIRIPFGDFEIEAIEVSTPEYCELNSKGVKISSK